MLIIKGISLAQNSTTYAVEFVHVGVFLIVNNLSST